METRFTTCLPLQQLGSEQLLLFQGPPSFTSATSCYKCDPSYRRDLQAPARPVPARPPATSTTWFPGGRNDGLRLPLEPRRNHTFPAHFHRAPSGPLQLSRSLSRSSAAPSQSLRIRRFSHLFANPIRLSNPSPEPSGKHLQVNPSD